MKIDNNIEIYEGIIDTERVSDYGNSNDFALCIDYDTIDNIFLKYRKRKVRVTIEVLED